LASSLNVRPPNRASANQFQSGHSGKVKKVGITGDEREVVVEATLRDERIGQPRSPASRQ
jgi:hypothetical protein